MPGIGLQCVLVVFPDHTQLLFGLYVMLLYPSENLNEIIASFHKLLNGNQIVTPRTLTLTPTTAPTESWSLCVDHALQATQKV